VAVCIVGGMDVCALLEDHINHSSAGPIPRCWGDDPTLHDCGSIGELVAAIRALDDRSDALLLALLDGPARRDGLCGAAIITALLPLIFRRSEGGRNRCDEFVAELAVVIGSVPIEALRQSRRRVGGVLLDRAWDQVREPLRRPDRSIPADPAVLFDRLADDTVTVEDDVLDRMAPAEARERVLKASESRPWVVAAWNSAIELWDLPHRDSVEARRWQYVRRVLKDDPLVSAGV
jgi:hypothetical protein